MSKAVYLGQVGSSLYLDVLFDYPVSPIELRYIEDVTTYLSMFLCNRSELNTLEEKKLYFTIILGTAIVYNGDDKTTFYFDLDKSTPN